MYLDFYGLAEHPFSATPDPRFLLLTEGHREALAQLVYGVQERKGFLVLTGEIGTGKTTLLHALLQKLDAHTAAAFVFNSMLPFEGILEYALEDWGVPKPGDSHAQRLVALNGFLTERRRAGQNTVLILDEAQNLDPRTLEGVRLLSNFETATDKLLQILLVGQPELGDRLALPELRQLKQRIALRCRIGALTPAETARYVRSRLRVAGARDPGLFTDGAVARVAAYTGGTPRLINTVCDHALLIGYADRTRRVDAKLVEQAIQYLEADAHPAPRGRGGVRQVAARARTGVGRLPHWVRTVGAVAAGLVAALALWPVAVRDVVSPLAELAARLRELVGR